jgi:hypothetical protein
MVGLQEVEAQSDTTQLAYVPQMEKMLKNGVFWNVAPCGSCENRRFGGT